MAEIIRMPRMSDTMEEGVIVEWLKKEGDSVEPGDVLAEVETDKATMELENYHEGVLLYIGVKEGPVPVNGVLAVIGEKGEDFQSLLAEAEKADSAETKKEEPQEEATAVPTESVAEAPVSVPSESSVSADADANDRIKASPLAKAMAQEAGIDLSQLSGTGDNQRIVKKDVEAFLRSNGASQKTEAASPVVPSFAAPILAPDAAPVDKPISQMRKTIAKRLGESKFSAPHFYLTIDIDMGRASDSRSSIKAMSGIKVSFNDMVIKACAIALRAHPAINSSWLGDKIRQNNQINIGVAVAVPDGLLVPVVNNADYKSMTQINAEVRELAEKAKNKKLQPVEMQGNTFTISNLGMFGIEEFTAIINPPDACILAVGSIVEKPIVKNGEISIGKMMKVTLSCDHRVVDGATGAKFLQTVKQLLEEPVMMLV